MPTRSESARARWANLTDEQRTERARRAAQGVRFAAAKRRCAEYREHLTAEQRAALARILAPEAFPG